MRKSLSPKLLGAVAALLGSAMLVGPARAQEQVVEKIPLQFVDARYAAFILGGQILPTEADLWIGRGGGYRSGLAGPTGGGVAPGNGVLADPATNSLLMLQGSRQGYPYTGSALYGNPNTNSLLLGPQRRVQPSYGAGQNRLYGVPGSNSLRYRYR